ncbi:PEPxxWA-CTERM sorting domain-containing protein [Oxalobacteraceae bacterium A2-2]
MAHYMKRMAALAALGCALAGQQARAERVTVDFTAVVTALVEVDFLAGTINAVDHNYVTPVDVRLGDTITGQYSYDLSLATLSAYQSQPRSGSQTYYDLPGVSVSYTLVRGGFSYQSDPSLVYSVAVSNNSSDYYGADAVEFATGNFGMITTAGYITLSDGSATALSDTSLPAPLNESLFGTRTLQGFWVDGFHELSISATLQSVSPGTLAPVPEPETWAMLLGGLGLVGAVARRRSFRA